MLPAAGGEENVMFNYLLHVFPIVNHSRGGDPLLIGSHVLWGSLLPFCSNVHLFVLNTDKWHKCREVVDFVSLRV